eukprot:TRINITY_DN12314_c6_g1_i1.p1 TRINITY_DN12314_c6_g1~~TRINITY_DN12314_c6_g1_i1.p1  ORF type:complete len:409 (+),score=91.71 TRINITY_DN12314_c6_g1_i1:74-1300(+)
MTGKADEQMLSVLAAYDEIRSDMVSVLSKNSSSNMRGFDTLAVSEIIASKSKRASYTEKECTSELEESLEKLSCCHIDFDTLSMALNQQKCPVQNVSSSPANIGNDDEIALLQLIDHPLTGKRVNFNTLDLTELTTMESTLKESRAINVTLATIIRSMDKISQINEKVHRKQQAEFAANAQKLREALYITKKKLSSKTDLLKVYRSFGVQIGNHAELEEIAEESVDEFNNAKLRIHQLEQELNSYNDIKTEHLAAMNRLSKNCQLKEFELLGQRQKCDTLTDKVKLLSVEAAAREKVIEKMQSEIQSCREVLVEILPNIEQVDQFDLVSLVDRVKDAIVEIREALNYPSSVDVTRRDSVMKDEVIQIVNLSKLPMVQPPPDGPSKNRPAGSRRYCSNIGSRRHLSVPG